MPYKNSSGNITILLVLTITVLIGFAAGAIFYLRNPKTITTGPKKAVENFYSEPAGIDTRLPDENYVPTNTADDIKTVKTSPTKQFDNQLYGIRFTYPTYWGTPKLNTSSAFAPDEEWLKSCLNKEELDYVNKISHPISLSFDDAKCGKDWCSVSVNIYNFDPTRHYQFWGYEGLCSISDIYKTKEEINNKANLNINKHVATTVDGMFPPSRSFTRTIKTVPNENQLYEISAGYKFANDVYNRMPGKKDDSLLDTLIKNNPNNPDFEIANQFLKDLNKFIESLIK